MTRTHDALQRKKNCNTFGTSLNRIRDFGRRFPIEFEKCPEQCRIEREGEGNDNEI